MAHQHRDGFISQHGPIIRTTGLVLFDLTAACTASDTHTLVLPSPGAPVSSSRVPGVRPTEVACLDCGDSSSSTARLPVEYRGFSFAFRSNEPADWAKMCCLCCPPPLVAGSDVGNAAVERCGMRNNKASAATTITISNDYKTDIVMLPPSFSNPSLSIHPASQSISTQATAALYAYVYLCASIIELRGLSPLQHD